MSEQVPEVIIELEGEPKLVGSRERLRRIGAKLTDWLGQPVIVAVVRSSSAQEYIPQDRSLPQYYLDHPETDRDDLLVDTK